MFRESRLNESSTEQEIPADGSKKAMMEEEQAERLRARLEQKHPAHNNPTPGDVAQGTALVAAG